MQTASILEQFAELGYVVVEDVLDPQQDLQRLTDDYSGLLDELAVRWVAEGKLSSTYRQLPFSRRFIKIVAESHQPWTQLFDISLPQSNVTEDTPIHLSEAVFDLLRNPRLLDAVEMFIGPEIYANPIQHIRVKPPEGLLTEAQRDGLGARTGWHQDQGVALPEADTTQILTVWLPVTDATTENGCLCVVPGSHRKDLITHCPAYGPTKGLVIPDQLLHSQGIAVPLKRGSVLFMHRRTIHSSLTNTSDDIRWSFDLRYQPIGQPTGRPAFPGFIARSRRHPETALTDWQAWANLWRDARTRLAHQETPAFNRWRADAPVCA